MRNPGNDYTTVDTVEFGLTGEHYTSAFLLVPFVEIAFYLATTDAGSDLMALPGKETIIIVLRSHKCL